MKRTIISLSVAVLFLLTMSGCHKDVFYGHAIFWFSQNNGTGTVHIDGQTGTITGFVTGGVPTCGDAYSANFTLPEGSYSYSASSTNGYTWNATANVYRDECQAYELR